MNKKEKTSISFRVLASLIYETILISGILFIASYPYVGLFLPATGNVPDFVFQMYLFSVCGVYFVWCWTSSGQTLAMKTWNLKLLTSEGALLTPKIGIIRYLLSLPSILLLIGIIWMMFDKDKCLLHDRLAGTRITNFKIDS